MSSDVARESGAGVCAMHMRGTPQTMQLDPRYHDVVAEIHAYLRQRRDALVAAGIPLDRICLDPGIGFGKTTSHNLDLLAHLDLLVDEGFPVLVGTSRKRLTGELLARSDAPGRGLWGEQADAAAPVALDDRVDASLATATWAMAQGASMVRAHDVAVTVQAATIVAGGFPVT